MTAQPKGQLFPKPRIRYAGDQALLVEIGEEIDFEINQKVHAFARLLEKNILTGIIEIIPAYTSLVVQFDALLLEGRQLESEIHALYREISEGSLPEPKLVTLPVCYDEEFGPDLSYVAKFNGLTPDEVIRLHTETTYPVYMIGFTPGFPYLGGLHEKLHTPRLDTPRASVAAGAVGIANNQTGLYPIESPGGWRIIGRCPYRVFDPLRPEPFLVSAGDVLQFTSISRDEFSLLISGGQV